MRRRVHVDVVMDGDDDHAAVRGVIALLQEYVAATPDEGFHAPGTLTVEDCPPAEIVMGELCCPVCGKATLKVWENAPRYWPVRGLEIEGGMVTIQASGFTEDGDSDGLAYLECGSCYAIADLPAANVEIDYMSS